ncbi:bifunctional riboflavin kinase/FAD synthetase [Telmatospirillum sp. J64-1]|uniref:bifunctional riboflavin kinase/FAD synthetase n=1 Tax=Telmatospirillum sp. J64-1 TaxID=2502183 RepID=UPI00115C5067|nr:bifunctional riboflavin kinase/FAD synthetase [Telmatospirillum sp. J64-1]
MRIFRHYAELPAEVKGGVVALGNFDGVHCGHQAVIGRALAVAADLGVPSGVMTFEPHPRAFFNPALANFRLSPFRIKARLIEALGVESLFMQHFDSAFAALTAERFVEEVLVAGLGVRHVVVGYDYVFGKGRQGDPQLLRDMAVRHGFGVDTVEPVRGEGGVVYSSTRIREHLAAGRPGEASRLLGRYWEIEGRVEHGDARGRTIGFPTANLHLGEYLHPARGVYAVRAGVDRGGETLWMNGVANFGRRPTFDKTEALLEVHLLDYSGDLYGQHLRVALVDFLRPERKFDGIDALKAQINQDAADARRVLEAMNFSGEPGPVVPGPHC